MSKKTLRIFCKWDWFQSLATTGGWVQNTCRVLKSGIASLKSEMEFKGEGLRILKHTEGFSQ